MTHTSDKLREEFADWLNEPHAWPPNENQIADWFISKLETAIKDRERERLNALAKFKLTHDKTWNVLMDEMHAIHTDTNSKEI